MSRFIFLFSLLLSSAASFAQTQTQTVTGRVYDEASGAPLAGVIVVVTDLNPLCGTATDSVGNFRLDSISIGRHNIKISYVSFEEKTLSDIEVTAGKQVNLTIGLQEAVKTLKEVTVVYNRNKDKNATVNDMAMVSARSFNVDETKLYAGSLGDPSRMAANFAGVVAGNDSRNDIVVRGNSPDGMLWQIDGLNTPNPNHFGALNSTGGPVSMLNNNNIDKSDFLTGAFPPQFGNALAGVFDIRLREGNHDKQEYVAQVGFNGFEGGMEGPIGSNKQTSYLVNYRYSTLGVFKDLGINLGTGSAVPIYQDLNYKVVSRLNKKSKVSLFGIIGNSAADFLGKDVDTTKPDLYTNGSPYQNTHVNYTTTITGASYDYQISDKSSTKLVAGYCTTAEAFSQDSLSSDYKNTFPQAWATFKTEKASLVWTYLHKFDAKNNIQIGANYDYTTFTIKNFDSTPGEPLRVYVNQTGNIGLAQAYAQWKHRFNQKFSLVTGIHYQYLSLNGSQAIEPRGTLRYTLNSSNSFTLGLGMHNQAQQIYSYYVRANDSAGTQTNKNLDFTRSSHIVLAYDHNITRNLRLKVETFYQYLDKVPVTSFASSYSAINEGISFAPPNQDSLVNKGTGYNYGVELTVEHFLKNGFYFLVTGSLIDSRYKGSDGIERNTAYNTGYVANILGGKEFKVGHRGNIFAVNLKMSTIGGRYLTPIDTLASRLAGGVVFNTSRAYSTQQTPYFRVDLKLSFKKEYRKSTMEFSLDLENITNHQNVFDQTYDPIKNRVGYEYQQGFFPVPTFRWTF